MSDMTNMTYARLREVMREMHDKFPWRPDPLMELLRMPRRFIDEQMFEPPPPPQKVELRDIKLSDGTPLVSPQFRAEYNAWLLERFGRREHFVHRSLLAEWGMSIVVNPSKMVTIANTVA